MLIVAPAEKYWTRCRATLLSLNASSSSPLFQSRHTPNTERMDVLKIAVIKNLCTYYKSHDSWLEV